MKNLVLILALFAGIVHAENAAVAIRTRPLPDGRGSETEPRALASGSGSFTAGSVSGRKLWAVSVASLAAANVLDIHSSWGKRELNPALASPSGRFGRDGALIKLGLQSTLVGVEYLLTRGRPSGKLYRALSFINFGAAAATAGVAAHNYTIPRPR